MVMKVFVIFGPPGVGKGTQCSLVADRLLVQHVSTGSIIRGEIASGSPLGLRVKDIVAGGKLVDDATLFSCLDGFLSRSNLSEGVLLLDGVPRTTSQISGLDSVLAKLRLEVNGVISITAPVGDLISRFAKRWTCVCGQVMAFDTSEVAMSAKCCKCSAIGKFARREDDKPEVVAKRMEIYLQETEPIAAIYRTRGKIREVDGLRSVEEVYLDVGRCIVEMT